MRGVHMRAQCYSYNQVSKGARIIVKACDQTATRSAVHIRSLEFCTVHCPTGSYVGFGANSLTQLPQRFVPISNTGRLATLAVLATTGTYCCVSQFPRSSLVTRSRARSPHDKFFRYWPIRRRSCTVRTTRIHWSVTWLGAFHCCFLIMRPPADKSEIRVLDTCHWRTPRATEQRRASANPKTWSDRLRDIDFTKRPAYVLRHLRD
nr:hypothetical protein CFP56_55926 [Quercus suber]